VVDRHTLFRAGVALLLDEHRDLEMAAGSAGDDDLETIISESKVDVALLDLELDAADATTLLGTLRTLVRVIAVTDGLDLEPLKAALASGVNGALLKHSSSRRMIEAIRAVRAGARWIDPGIRELLRSGVARPAGLPDKVGRRPHTSLTPREGQIAQLAAQGIRYNELAKQLKISPHTVKNHLRRVFEKLEVSSRTELAVVYSKRERS
jgi:DNA-binding NarL/FixJ family response regulator